MPSTTPRLLVLVLLGLLLAACGDRANAPSSADVPALPLDGTSWVAGDRQDPHGGRIVVGLLLEQRSPRHLADLIPPEKLEAWFATEHEREEPEVVEVGSWRPPLARTWGLQAAELRTAAKGLREDRDIEVVFREVLADEIEDLPLVLLGTRRTHAHERRRLVDYKARGGRVLALGRATFPQAPLSDAEAVRRALDDVVASSPLVHPLPHDPFALAGVREGDDVVLSPPLPGASATLVDGAGATVADARPEADGRLRLHAPDPALDPFQHRVVVTWRGEGLELARAWSVAELVGTVETLVEAGDAVPAGGAMALRVSSRLRDAPVADRAIHAQLVRDGEVLAAAHVRTDDRGLAFPRLVLPSSVAPGPAVLRCEGLEQALEITTALRLSVVTDRPLYKPTDAVHVRLMAHRAGDGRPVGGQAVVLSIGDAKRTVTTSEHGIASHTFALHDARVGGSRVVAEADGAQAHCAFRVRTFERPTFTVVAEPAALALRPGESAPVRLTARYVNGTPFVGGSVDVEPVGVTAPTVPHDFDPAGHAALVVKAGSRQHGHVTIAVQDAEGRRAELTIPVTVQREAPPVELERLSDLLTGLPARFRVTAATPGTLHWEGDFVGTQAVETDAEGRAELVLVPLRDRSTLRMWTEGSAPRTWTFDVPGGDRRLGMALDRRGARVGESLRIDFKTSRPSGLAYVDVWNDATPVRTLAATIKKGQGTVTLPLDASMAGVLQVHAYFADERAAATRATVLVTRGRALQVEAATREDRHAPGAVAEVDVTVKDAAGEPTAAVLGYWGVDEALLALAPATTGHERVFDVASSTERARVLALAEAVDRRLAIAADALADPFRDGVDRIRAFPVRLERTPRLAQAAAERNARRMTAHVQALWKAYAAAWTDVPVTALVRSDSLRETVQWLVREGRLDAALLRDPWGTPLALWSDRHNLAIAWTSAGPDRVFGTPDDQVRGWDGSALYEVLPAEIRAFHAYVREHLDPTRLDAEEPVIKDEEIAERVETDNDLVFEESFGEGASWGAVFEGPTNNGLIGLGGGAGGMFSGRFGARAVGSGGGGSRVDRPSAYLRRDFDPTLCFVPEAIVGPEGRTRLQIPLKDSITTWRLRLVASAADGATGVGTGTVRVGQSVHASPWMASHLTVGDHVALPVAIRNEEAHPVAALVTLTASPHLTAEPERAVRVDVPARGTGRVVFHLEAVQAGSARVRIEVDAGEARDAQERVITVHRHARPVVAVASGSVTGDAAFPVAGAGAGPGDVRLDLYPSPLTEIVSGFDGLIAAPHG